MPIKFRCGHCRQYLGISESRAGKVVDCPKCGRSIRVPGLDGTAKPVLAPKLNLNDENLTSALSVLATISTEPTPTNGPTQPPPVIAVAAIPNAAPIVSAPAVAQNLRVTTVEVAHGSTPSPKSPWEELSPLADGAARQALAPNPAGSPSILRTALLMTAFAACAIGGIAVGRWLFPQEKGQPATAAAAQADATKLDKSLPVPGTSELRLSGRISYRANDGTIRPDAGAVLLAFPTETQATMKFSAVGFRPGDREADRKIAAAMMSAAGGLLAVTDDEGHYAGLLPMGQYHIVVLSPQAEKESPTDLTIVNRYFERPDQLIGKRAAFINRLKGSISSEIWDHVF